MSSELKKSLIFRTSHDLHTNVSLSYYDCISLTTLWITIIFYVDDLSIYRPLGYERVYLPLYKEADTPFHIQGDDIVHRHFNDFSV